MGIPFTMEDIIEIVRRIATIRMAFTIREGMIPGSFTLPGRMLGKPSLTSGPLEGVKLSSEQQTRDYLEAMGWDPGTARPLPETVRQLGFDRVIN
jgi:aldehyde:ferredoxin oxidoreductase